ncbi:MAG TPA: DUF3592 domain-containing protein [Cyclobacteriaceae bacterium]|jgi:hypothetical protein|nr:DUF3592 domain-containing protein [Cytophagales bacterium]HRF32763.1 DUF3592 domain-containing protein [Cyclobacteriaceae bacterium]
MSDPKHIKDQVKKLLESDQRYQAIRLIQNAYNVSEREAEKLLSTLDKDDEPAQNTPLPPTRSGGCLGCFSGLFKVGSILFALAGILLLGILAVVYYYAEDFKKESIPVRGIVADTVHVSRTTTDTIQNVYLILNYEVRDSLRSYQTTTSYPETLYPVQDSVDLRVNPNDADYATIDDESFFDDVFLVFGIAAGVMFFFAIVLWVIGRAANNRPAT